MVLALGANAQGRNTGMGGSDGDYQSLSERVFKLEKKTDAFNVYFNYAAAFQELFTEDDNFSKFTNKQARIEIKGNLTDKISYRWRHRLNKNNTAMGTDNFAKATDILMATSGASRAARCARTTAASSSTRTQCTSTSTRTWLTTWTTSWPA